MLYHRETSQHALRFAGDLSVVLTLRHHRKVIGQPLESIPSKSVMKLTEYRA